MGALMQPVRVISNLPLWRVSLRGSTQYFLVRAQGPDHARELVQGLSGLRDLEVDLQPAGPDCPV